MVASSPPQRKQLKTVKKFMAIQCLRFSFRLYGVPHICDISKNEPKGRNSLPLVVSECFHFDLLVDFASLDQPFLVGGLW